MLLLIISTPQVWTMRDFAYFDASRSVKRSGL